jgi:hypothetical protein
MSGSYYGQTPEDPKQIADKIEAGVSASTEEAAAILRQIHETAWDAKIPNDKKMTSLMAMFATLIVSLSIKADRLQRWLVGLTVVIAILTLVLVALTVALIIRH